jgi:large conductance mechanosensitive channel
MGLLQEFKTFALKGNVVDMAVGVIIGGAFGKIVTSLVNDILMPPLGVIMGGKNFADLSLVIKRGVPAVMDGDVVVTPEVAEVVWKYGAFIQQVVDFLIIAASIFVLIKVVNKLTSLRNKEEEAPEPEPAPAPEPEPTKEELLLTEIRDLLKNKQ